MEVTNGRRGVASNECHLDFHEITMKLAFIQKEIGFWRKQGFETVVLIPNCSLSIRAENEQNSAD